MSLETVDTILEGLHSQTISLEKKSLEVSSAPSNYQMQTDEDDMDGEHDQGTFMHDQNIFIDYDKENGNDDPITEVHCSVNCLFGGLDNGEKMIACDGCDIWFHPLYKT
jgi:hypothetical protein